MKEDEIKRKAEIEREKQRQLDCKAEGYTSCRDKDNWDVYCKKFTWRQLEDFEKHDFCLGKSRLSCQH